ncbi:hypothetical protein F6455_16100 [Proteobacteria bacterium 005FR1]|nr:hypothetical protein [Proteobacteria bacterium 005FR1]
MVQDRREPTISIKPERDEIASHQNRMNERPKAGPAAGGPGPAARPAKARTSATAVFAFLLAIAGIGTGAFAVWQLQQAQQSLAAADGRIAELEARLNLTNTESDQSVTKIHEKLDWADSEIRKLWGVAYDTNRKAIAANTSDIASVGKVANTAAADAKKANSQLSSQQNTLATLQTQSGEQQLLVTRANEQIDTLQQQLRQMTDKANRLESQLAKLDSLNSRVATNEEAIKAIDAFRRSANSDIQQLKDRVATGG